MFQDIYSNSYNCPYLIFQYMEIWCLYRCVHAVQMSEYLHLESVVVARALLLAARFYSSHPVKQPNCRLDAVAACIVHLAMKPEVCD